MRKQVEKDVELILERNVKRETIPLKIRGYEFH